MSVPIPPRSHSEKVVKLASALVTNKQTAADVVPPDVKVSNEEDKEPKDEILPPLPPPAPDSD